jgi:hypothetical protein|tara:strand:+ start:221628 stop:222599 length:972 start_codon:yes stop_codon:yes gene_type:complete
MAKFTSVSYAEDPSGFLLLLQKCTFPESPSIDQFKLESGYRFQEVGASFSDLSFFVVKNDVTQALVLAHKSGEFIGFNGSGAEIHTLEPHKKLIVYILDTLIDLSTHLQAQTLKIDDTCSRETLSIIGQEIFNRKGSPHTQLRAAQDLKQDHKALHTELRQSYKALVNQGLREIDFKHIDKTNLNESLFSAFKAFHQDIAGRQTRSDESWHKQFEMIEAGCAELIMGYMEPHGLVSAALFTDYGTTTSYAVAVYNRDLFDKPLAHANVYEGMTRAKARGQNIFNLGIITPYDKDKEKEYNIGKFKKGFCRELSPFIEWSIPIA